MPAGGNFPPAAIIGFRRHPRLCEKKPNMSEARRLAAKPVVEQLRAGISRRVEDFKVKYGRAPRLAVVLVGDDPASVIYTNNKGKAATAVGMEHETLRFPATASPDEVFSAVRTLNDSAAVDGILIQRPLPPAFDESAVLRWVAPEKDVDGFHPENVGAMSLGLPALISCTPFGVMKMLEHYGISPAGKTVVVVGRSNIVGKPMASLLLKADATVIQCHSRTRNLAEMTRQGDILVVAAGRPRLVGPEHVKPGAVVIDVGVHRQEDGSLCGDVDFEGVSKVASAVTPVPGGVGPMTITLLLQNTIEAAERRESTPR